MSELHTVGREVSRHLPDDGPKSRRVPQAAAAVPNAQPGRTKATRHPYECTRRAEPGCTAPTAHERGVLGRHLELTKATRRRRRRGQRPTAGAVAPRAAARNEVRATEPPRRNRRSPPRTPVPRCTTAPRPAPSALRALRTATERAACATPRP